METLAVFHILKNGGTTLVDRYKNNPTFVYQRIYDEVAFNYKQSNQTRVEADDCKDKNIRMIFGHGVDFSWDNILLNPIKYATILRDPIARMMSAYNYFRLEMATIHNHMTDIDFKTWLINCDRVLPTPVFAQYQQFCDERYCRQQSLRIDYGRKLNEYTQTKLYDQALKNIDKLSYVLFMEDNYIEKFDLIASKFDLKADTSVTHTHSTGKWLTDLGVDYINFNNLGNTEKELLMDTVAKDVEFYNYCKEKFV